MTDTRPSNNCRRPSVIELKNQPHSAYRTFALTPASAEKHDEMLEDLFRDLSVCVIC